MTATALEFIDITDRLAEIEETTNDGFAEIGQKMGLGSVIEKTGAWMVATGTASAEGINIAFDLQFSKVDVKTMSAFEAVDVVLVQEYTKVFGDRFLNR